MSEDLRKDVEQIKKELERLANEIKEIKGEEMVVVEEVTGRIRHEPKEVVNLYDLMKEKAAKLGQGGVLVNGGVIVKDGQLRGGWQNWSSVNNAIEVTEKEVIKFLAPLSSEQRIVILKSLYKGFPEGKTVSELTEETGYEGGQLYHHLRELERAEYIETKQERGRWFLTNMGLTALATSLHLVYCLHSPEN